MRRWLCRHWRYVFSALAMALLVHYVGPSALLETFHGARWGWLLGFAALTAVSPAFLGVQAWGVLRLLGHPIGAPRAIAAAANAWSIGTLTPARAGDLSLAHFLGEEASTGDLIAIVALDKILSLTVLALGAVASVSAIALPHRDAIVAAVSVVIAGLLLVILTTRLPGVVAPALKVLGRPSGSLPGEAYESLRRLMSHPGVLGWSLGVVLGRWAVACAATWIAFHALGHGPDILHVTAATMVGRIIAALPVSIGGIGIKEPVQMTIYALQDVPPEAVVAISLLGMTLRLLLAALLPLLIRPKITGVRR